MRRWISLVCIAILCLMLLLFGIRVWRHRDPNLIPSPLIGRQVPAFSLASPLGGNQPGLSSQDLRAGQVTLVNVFASWCPSCVSEHPYLGELAAPNGQLSKAHVQLVGLTYKDNADDIRAYLAKGNPYARIGSDKEGKVGIDWGVYGVPETFVVAGDGTIVYKLFGELTPDTYEKKIKPAIEKAQARSQVSASVKP